ncbi:MAG: apolipoprotein N-acyltransferase [Oligoflexia bacterium]|nr:apolipoprotein N-acyltransferase [Oligoflexia bacterium]
MNKSYSFFGATLFQSYSYRVTNVEIYFYCKLCAVFLFINILFPLRSYFHYEDKVNNIRIVQANVANFLKISSEKGAVDSIQEILNKYYKLSIAPSDIKKEEEMVTIPFVAKENLKKSALDLIIWPETAYPYKLYPKNMKNISQISEIFLDIMKKNDAQMFFGGYADREYLAANKKELLANDEDFINYFERTYNSAFLLTERNGLDDVYYKKMLIPFGETLPFWQSLNRFISKHVQNISFFARGDSSTLFKTKNNTYFISAICYELLFSNFIRDLLNESTVGGNVGSGSANIGKGNKKQKEPHFLINLTNDSWYGDTIEPYQHLFLGKWRALEFDLPIVRSTNTGISLVIYPDGSESPRIEIGESKFLDVKLITPDRKPTIYQQYGKAVLWTIWIALMLFAVIPFRKIFKALFSKKKTLFKKVV